MKRSWFAAPYAIWIVLFTVVPLLLIMYYSFTAPGGGATLQNFQQFFSPIYLDILLLSLYLALLCTAICLVIGYPAALILSGKAFRNSTIWVILFLLPMWMNFLVRTYAWMTILEDTGLINKFLQSLGFPKMQLLYTEGAVLMGMVYNFLPFMVLPIYTVIKKLDVRLVEAAQDLGCNSFMVLFKVIMPLSIPGVISGITMVYMPAVTTFVISRLLGGGRFMLFGDVIEQQFLVSYNWNFGSALSLIMMALVLLSIGVMRFFDAEGEGAGAW